MSLQGNNNFSASGGEPLRKEHEELCLLEESLRHRLNTEKDALIPLAEIISIYEGEGRNDEELQNLYWDFIKGAFITKNDKNYKKCLNYFSAQMKRKPGYGRAAELLPSDCLNAGALDEKYLKKEKNLIPNDFFFRYGHHDYKLLKGFKNKLGSAVLHLGCNRGLNSILLARNGFFVHGVDIQKQAVINAIELRGDEIPEVAMRATFQAASFTSMSLPNDYFDSVIAFDVFEHIYESDLEAVFNKISSAVKKGGCLIFHVPRLNSFYDSAHVTVYDEDKARAIFGRKFIIERIFVTSENEYPGNERVNIIARNGMPENAGLISEKLPYEKIATFSSGFFNNHYTREKGKLAIRRLYDETSFGGGFSMIRIGDVETRFLAFGHGKPVYDNPREEAGIIEKNLGINPLALPVEKLALAQKEFVNCILEADILGTHRFTVNEKWSDDLQAVYKLYGIKEERLANELDVVFNAEILDQGFLLPVLGRGRILLIGNAAPRFARLLQNESYRREFKNYGMPGAVPDLAGCVYVPHQGALAFEHLEKIWEEISRMDFDTAFIAASLTGKILAGRIKRILRRTALDIGWSMQFLANSSSPAAPARDENYMRGRRGFNNLFKGRTK
jgi:2-polyprenyl-3-methyl-5-hydroxy-6-metoxy-1,4-benzoquinol methylase